jgi:hypothetical protein
MEMLMLTMEGDAGGGGHLRAWECNRRQIAAAAVLQRISVQYPIRPHFSL